MNSGTYSSTSYLINSVERKLSTNDKEEFVKERLRRLEIAYEIMAEYPEVLNKFRRAMGKVTQ